MSASPEPPRPEPRVVVPDEHTAAASAPPAASRTEPRTEPIAAREPTPSQPPPAARPQPQAPNRPAPTTAAPVQSRPTTPTQQPSRPNSASPASRTPAPPQPRASEVEPKPAVGSRIQLPANTRRLPGGIAARMDDDTPRRDSPREMPQVRHGGERRGDSQTSAHAQSPSSGPSPIGQPLKPGVQTRPGPGRPGATGITGTRPLQTTGTKPLTSGSQPQQQPPQQQQQQQPQQQHHQQHHQAPSRQSASDRAHGGLTRGVEVTRGPQGTPIATRAANPVAAPVPQTIIETDEATGRRVVRNESGVIVGAASQRAEPKIVGFIPLANRARPQQVIITDASETEQRGRATVRKQREERAQAQGRRRKMTVRNMGRRPGGPATRITTQEMSDAKKRIRVDEVIQIADLAHQMGKKATAVLRLLWGMGMRGLTINNVIDSDTAELVASEFGYTIDNVAFQEDEFIEGWDEAAGETRAPVVTFMGHVDHGKTSLMDALRKSAVAKHEAGGITQHIGAYKVSTPKGDVVFLDTPGHEAFSAMRTRGAQVTDVVVLVVAADDGIMPTTIEAIKQARDANVPIVVAINKVDKPDANPGRIKQMLMEYHLVGEEFGGDTIICEVSAKTGKNIDQLLEMLAVQAEILDLRATSAGRAQGVVLEARVDKGRGPISTVLVEAGTLIKGDIVVANEYSGKVRGLLDDRGKTLEAVGPSTPVELLGLDGVPSAGDRFNVVENEKAARQLIAHRRETRRRKESVRTGPSIQDFIQRKKTPTLKIVMRADVQGSAEALKQALLELSTDKVKVEVILAGVGAITQTDVKMASAGEAVIIGFSTKPVGKAAPTAEAEKVPIFVFNIIYEALDKVRELMIGLLEPEYREREQGEAEVRALFPIPKIGVVAGCRVTRGIIQRSSHVRVVRRGVVIHKGKIASLRVMKDDVKEVRDGFECGIVVDSFPEIEPGDIIQAFDMETLTPTL
ncbi:MAG: translation initiation factor IF-2 [Nannocystis sp.]|nr:translation initiation factor IF-2 [Nannocystis sp.]